MRNVDPEKSEPQMGFEPTTLRDLVGCYNHWATGDSAVSKGQIVGIMWQRDAVSEFQCDALMWQRDAVSEIIWAKYVAV